MVLSLPFSLPDGPGTGPGGIPPTTFNENRRAGVIAREYQR